MDSTAAPSGSPAKEPPRNLLRRKTNISMAMPTLLTLYFLGAGIAFMVCTRTFLSFHISSPESQPPVQLPGQESLTVTVPEKGSALEVLQELYQSPAHTLRDVRSVHTDSDNESTLKSSGSFGEAPEQDPEVDESEQPEFMQKPILGMNTEKAADLQSRLKRMTSWERRRWLTEHWSSFQILKVDSLSRQFGNRMQQFFCSDPSLTVTAAKEDNIRRLLLPESSVDQMDEKKICKTNGASLQGSSAFCRQRFVLTWMSPVTSFGPRERLTLESIFKWHPTACVVIFSRTMDSSPGRKILEPFVARGYRIMAVTPDLESLFANLPAATWLQRLRDGTGDPGCINLMQNLSNLMRLAALYKYGGVYLDTDVVVLKPFEELRNVVGAQSHDATTGHWTRLNNAVLVFDRAHPVVYEFLREFVETFDGSRWGWNGPYLVSRVVEKVIQVQHWQNCSSVSVLPQQAFYPVNWIDVVHFFQRPTEELQSKRQAKELEWMRQGSYAIHLWNKKSNFLKVGEGSIMETLFKQSCLFCKVAGS